MVGFFSPWVCWISLIPNGATSWREQWKHQIQSKHASNCMIFVLKLRNDLCSVPIHDARKEERKKERERNETTPKWIYFVQVIFLECISCFINHRKKPMPIALMNYLHFASSHIKNNEQKSIFTSAIIS